MPLFPSCNRGPGPSSCAQRAAIWLYFASFLFLFAGFLFAVLPSHTLDLSDGVTGVTEYIATVSTSIGGLFGFTSIITRIVLACKNRKWMENNTKKEERTGMSWILDTLITLIGHEALFMCLIFFGVLFTTDGTRLGLCIAGVFFMFLVSIQVHFGMFHHDITEASFWLYDRMDEHIPVNDEKQTINGIEPTVQPTERPTEQPMEQPSEQKVPSAKRQIPGIRTPLLPESNHTDGLEKLKRENDDTYEVLVKQELGSHHHHGLKGLNRLFLYGQVETKRERKRKDTGVGSRRRLPVLERQLEEIHSAEITSSETRKHAKRTQWP